MKQRKANLEWMRKLLADLEESRSDPRIADLMMEGLTEPSPSIAAQVEPNLEILDFPPDDTSARAAKR